MPTKPLDKDINTGFKLPIRATRRKTWAPYHFSKLMTNTLAPHITSGAAYKRWIADSNIAFLPKHPETVYKDFSWSDYLEVDILTPMQIAAKVRCEGVKPREMWEAIKWAQQYCHENQITTRDAWRKGYDETKIPKDIPKNPHIAYGKAFPGYPVWIGKKTIARIDAHTNVNAVLTLLHVAGQPINVVALRVWSDGLSDLRNNWSKQREFDRVLGQWKYERELMPQVEAILDTLGHKGDLYWTIPNMNAVLWELNSILMIVR